MTDLRKNDALNDVEKLGKIVFRAFNTKKQQAVKVGPLEDKTGKLYTGQGPTGYYESLTPKDMEKMAIVFDHSTVYVVEDGKSLNIADDPHDAALWKWIQKHPYIGLTRADCLVSRDAVFYVDNPQKKAEDYISRDKLITKTKTEVYNATNEQKVNLAKAMGLTGAEGTSPSQVEEWLILKVEQEPAAMSTLLNPTKASFVTSMGLIKEMLTYNVIKKFGTVLKYGGREGITLGNSEEEAAKWIADTRHEDTFISMKLDLDSKKGLV